MGDVVAFVNFGCINTNKTNCLSEEQGESHSYSEIKKTLIIGTISRTDVMPSVETTR